MGRTKRLRVTEQYGLYSVAGINICAEAARWIQREWPKGVKPGEFWEECNVPTWMAWIAQRMANGGYCDLREDALYPIWDDVRSVVGDGEDTEARPDIADALRVIIPAPLFERIVAHRLEVSP